MSTRHLSDYQDALAKVVKAWESLPGGKNYSPDEIQVWLSTKMAPAINDARQVLGDGPAPGGVHKP